MVVDEPTEHLDRATADALMGDILALTADKALLVVTHDPTLVARCDKVVWLFPSGSAALVDGPPRGANRR